MDKMLETLTPAFVASFALQQLIELLDPMLDALVRPAKKWILSLVALAFALVLTFGFGFRLLAPLGYGQPTWLDGIVTALFLTGGTKGMNDLLKWLGYKKEGAKKALSPEEARKA